MELTAYITRLGTYLNFYRKTAGLEFTSPEAGLAIPNKNNDGHVFTFKACLASVLVPVLPQDPDLFSHLFTKGMGCEITPIDNKYSQGLW